MAHIFISYARSTEPEATAIGHALRELGYEIWRDDELPAHRSYTDVIEERLGSANAVLVLWSAEAAKSYWVRAEADKALSLRILVQATLDGTMPPMPFNQVECANLRGWQGSADAHGWRKLVASIAELSADEPRGTKEGAAAAPRPRRKTSVCVLPFANMSGDPEQEYFSDGISEDIITDLSKVSALSVTARNTAFTFKGKAVDIPVVARQLNVSHVLEGSVRKAGDRVRITAQLIDGEEGDHLWAERWDRELYDIFELQDEIAKAIVAGLKVKLLPSEEEAIERRGTSSSAAYDLYLMARQQWVCGNEGDRRRDDTILSLCRRATELDPQYAQAWALMALAHMELRFRHGRAEDDGLEAATRALSIDPTLPEGHAVQARYLAAEGRSDEAVAAIATALRLDPDSWEVNREAGTLSFRDGRIEQAVPFFEKAAAMVETDYFDAGFLAVCYTALNRSDDARRAAEMTVTRAEKALRSDPGNAAALAHGAYSLALLGQRDRAREWTEQALIIDPTNLISRYRLACAHIVHLSDPDTAIELLEPYFASCSLARVAYAQRDPDMDSLRSDARFEALVQSALERLGSQAAD